MVYSQISNVHLRIFLLIALLLVAGVSLARSTDLVPLSRAFDTPDKITPEAAVDHFALGKNLIVGNSTFGFSKNYFWILTDLPSDINLEDRFFLDVDNPHIDEIRAYHVSNGELFALGRSGDRMPFTSRTYLNRSNVFPVQFRTPQDQLLLFVDKRNASVFAPIVLWESTEFIQHDAALTLSYGFYFGMLLLIMLYSLLIYLTQRSSIYIWYLIYVASLFLYTLTYIGFGFQYLFPNQYEWNNYLRLILIVVIVVSQIRFTQLFLPIRAIHKWVNRGFQLAAVSLALILLWWIIVPGLYTANTIWVINAIYALVGVTLLLIVVALVLSWKHDRSSVLFYAAAFGMNVIATVLLMAEEFGVLDLSYLPLPPMFIGTLFEIVIFAIGLSYRSKLIGDDRKKLLSNINSLQQQAMQAFVRGMEEEKIRVANELHDDVASRLSLLKMKVAGGEETELAEQIAEISDGVRRISHQLNPVSLNSETVLQKIQELVSEHRQAGTNIDFQFFDVEKSISEEVGLQLYRILQEALNNIQKHAKAQHVDLQIFVHDNELVMTIEDDGSGFDMAKQRTGLGTKNMRLRTEQVGGEFSISSAVDDGTSILVLVPIG